MSELKRIAQHHAAQDNGKTERQTELHEAPISPALPQHASAEQPAPVELSPPTDENVAEQAVLLSEIQALSECVRQRNPKQVWKEIHVYLDGARKLAEGETGMPCVVSKPRLAAARQLVHLAKCVYFGYVEKTNRGIYLLGVILSAAVVSALLPLIVFYVAFGIAGLVSTRDRLAASVFEAVDLPALFVLFGFAGLGSIASVFTRLDSIVVPQIFTKKLVFSSGAGRPVVAAVFAVVVYALVKGQLINITPRQEIPIHSSSIVHWWCVVVAFLCGYSERFAGDLIGTASVGDARASVAVASPPGPGERLPDARYG